MDSFLVVLVPNVVGGLLVVLLLLPVLRRCNRRFAAARECLVPDAGLQRHYDVARLPGWRGRLLFGYLLLGLVLVLGGLVVQTVVVQVIEPEADLPVFFLVLYLAPVVVPLLIGAVLGGQLVQQLVRGQARHQLLEDVLAQDPDRGGAAAARDELTAGRGALGLAGVGLAAVLACLAMGLGWVALLFVAAAATIDCARSAKCL